VKLWLDAQLSPALAPWLRARFGLDVHAVRDLGLRDAEDVAIFQAARQAGAVILTKDADFPTLVERFGPPPRVLWLRCGNSSNARLRVLLDRGERLVEISDPWTHSREW